MFQFTTTTVINSNVDTTTGKPLWSTRSAAPAIGEEAIFYVKRVNKFLQHNVVSIYKAEARDPELAKVTFDLSELKANDGDTFRLYMYVALTQGSNDSRYANDLEYKGKAFTVDFVYDKYATETVNRLVKTLNKYDMLVYGDKQLKVTGKGNYITIEAMNEYQRFRVVNIEKFDKDAHNGMGEYTPVITLEDLGKPVSHNADLTGSAKGYFPGKEGFGTYSYILHNLRIPTCARTRAFAPNQDETPIVGAKYNQYTLYYCVDRGILGDNAVGDVVKSMTTHVFYVKQDLAHDFEMGLRSLKNIVSLDKSEEDVRKEFEEDLRNKTYVRLNGNIKVETPFTISRATVIDLGGNTVYTEDEKNAFVFTSGESTIKNGEIVSNNKCALVKDGAKLTIESGNFLATNEEGAECVLVAGENSEVIIEGGTFEALGTYNDKHWVLNRKDSDNSAKIKVRGGRFKDFDPANPGTDPVSDGNGSYLDTGYKSEKIGDYYVVTKS